MQTVLSVYLRSLMLYLLITIPSILIPVMYFLSAWFAIVVSWVALIIFIISFFLLKKIKLLTHAKFILLLAATVFAVYVSFECVELFDLWDNIWADATLLLFPLAALAAAIISVFVSRKDLIHQLYNYETTIH